MLKPAARLERVGGGVRQVIEIVVSDGYHPNQIEARADLPLRLVFLRRDDHACSDRVIFSEPRLERRLAPHATTIVDLPPAREREIRFTCGMGRYRGRIELLPAGAAGAVARNRGLAAFARAAIVTVAAGWWLVASADSANLERAVLALVAAGALVAVLVAGRRAAVRPPRHR